MPECDECLLRALERVKRTPSSLELITRFFEIFLTKKIIIPIRYRLLNSFHLFAIDRFRNTSLYSFLLSIYENNKNTFMYASPTEEKACTTLLMVLFEKTKAEEIKKAFFQKKKLPAPVHVLFCDIREEEQRIFEEENPKSEELLQTLEKRRTERKKIIKTLQEKKDTLTQKIPKTFLVVPSPFYKEVPSTHSSFWDQTISVFKKAIGPFELHDLPKIRSDTAFLLWQQSEEQTITQAEKSLPHVEILHKVAKQLTNFFVATEKVIKTLYSSFVVEIIQTIENQIITTQTSETDLKNIFQELFEHEETLLIINASLSKNEQAFQEKKRSFIEEFFSSELRMFPDLPDSIQDIFDMTWKSTKIKGFLKKKDTPAIQSEIEEFYKKQLDAVTYCIDEGKERLRKIHEIDTFYKTTILQLAPIRKYKDMQEPVASIEQRLRRLVITKYSLIQTSKNNLSKFVETKYAAYETNKEFLKKELIQLEEKVSLLSQKADDALKTVAHRLFEVYTEVQPYPDLKESTRKAHIALKTHLKKKPKEFYEGLVTFDELKKALQDIAYDHDIVVLRNELTGRAERIRELRREAMHLLRSLEQKKRLLQIARKKNDAILLCIKDIKVFLEKIENPFTVFSLCNTKEKIGQTFRGLWIEIEEFQKKSAHIDASFEKMHALLLPVIEHRLMTTLDTIEEFVKMQTHTRPQLVMQIQTALRENPENQKWQILFKTLDTIEKKYDYVAPLSFYMLFEKRASILELLHRAADLNTKIEQTISFAKTLQQVKTFEEERIDDILEAFDRQHFIEEETIEEISLQKAFTRYERQLLEAFFHVTSDVFLDIGLLDIRALFDNFPEKLFDLLKYAVEQAKYILEAKEIGFLTRLLLLYQKEDNSLLLSIVHEEKNAIILWLETANAPISTPEEALNILQSFCHILFRLKILFGERQNNILAKKFILVYALEKYAQSTIEAIRTSNDTVAFEELNQFLQSIQEMSTTLDQQPFLKEVAPSIRTSIQDINKKFLIETDTLKSLRESLEILLMDFEENLKTTKVIIPFFYVSGFLGFFEQNTNKE